MTWRLALSSRFLLEMLGNLGSDNVRMEMSAPNRAGILIPADGVDEGEDLLMLVMPVMLNQYIQQLFSWIQGSWYPSIGWRYL